MQVSIIKHGYAKFVCRRLLEIVPTDKRVCFPDLTTTLYIK